MTKHLEKLLNLPPTKVVEADDIPSLDETHKFIEENRHAITAVDSAIDKIDAALETVDDLKSGDDELDELADLATEKFKEMTELGMNVDPRFAGQILQTASTLLGHAITAKTAKMDKKLKTIQLQLSKARLDHQITKEAEKTNGGSDPIQGEGTAMSRNDLLKQILESTKKSDN